MLVELDGRGEGVTTMRRVEVVVSQEELIARGLFNRSINWCLTTAEICNSVNPPQ